MNISTSDYSPIMESLQKSNELLRMFAVAKLSIDDKMLRANVLARLAGLGNNVDEYA
jgi:hypothetical protein